MEVGLVTHADLLKRSLSPGSYGVGSLPLIIGPGKAYYISFPGRYLEHSFPSSSHKHRRTRLLERLALPALGLDTG